MNLAVFITESHRSLRKTFKEAKDEEGLTEQLWIKHIQEKDKLKKYSETMYTLATKSWESDNATQINVSRIKWLHDAISTYFFKGDLHIKMAKECRKVYHTEEAKISYFEKVRDSLQKYEISRPLEVLDVGSCFNPFGQFEDFKVTAIDLCPANSEVFRCDFVTLKITDDNSDSSITATSDNGSQVDAIETRLEYTSGTHENIDEGQPSKRFKSSNVPIRGLECDITKMESASFDAVIFCYFLEYLPCPKMRFKCCEKAYKLLRPNGVLGIATPDSKNGTANIQLLNLWKITLENLGFSRIKYEKSPHFHGILFRKGIVKSLWQQDSRRELEALRNKTLSKRVRCINLDDESTIFSTIPIIQETENQELGK